MKGIILAGGNGTRLYPVTKSVSKHLLHVYDKPMIYYPLSILFMAKIQEILIICTPHHVAQYRGLLGDGSQWGASISYAIQYRPDGLGSAFILGEQFIGSDSVCLILGDNIFHGQGLIDLLMQAREDLAGGSIFCSYVKDPYRYGVVDFDEQHRICRIIEKPKTFVSNYAVTGLYFYENDVIEIAKNICLSARGELEISDINNQYLQQKRLKATMLSRGFAWFDVGTHQSLLDASQYIALLEERQSLKVGCVEEIAWRHGFIDAAQVAQLAQSLSHVDYGQYLLQILKECQNPLYADDGMEFVV